VFVRVKEHADLRREGLTVHSDVSVSYVDAILGMHTAVTKILNTRLLLREYRMDLSGLLPILCVHASFCIQGVSFEQHVWQQDKAVLQVSQLAGCFACALRSCFLVLQADMQLWIDV